jgi:hypothetical protein
MSIRIVALAAATSLAVPAVADARPLTFGVALGRMESDYEHDGEANPTKQLFGRVGLTKRLGIQLELQKIEDSDLNIRSGTALLVVELGNLGGRFVPLLVAGIGFDRESSDYVDETGSHKEGGLGVEYRADGGLTLGADLRLGGRSVERHYEPGIQPFEDGVALFAPYGMTEGEYRSARLYAAVRF